MLTLASWLLGAFSFVILNRAHLLPALHFLPIQTLQLQDKEVLNREHIPSKVFKERPPLRKVTAEQEPVNQQLYILCKCD